MNTSKNKSAKKASTANDLPVLRRKQAGEGQRELTSPYSSPAQGDNREGASLLYLNDTNGDKKKAEDGDKELETKRLGCNSYTAKKCYSLSKNVESLVKRYGIERLGFLTLTFKENLTDHKEAQRRYKNLSRTWRRDKPFKYGMKVVEEQARGAIHYHLLVVMDEDIRTNFDFQTFKRAGEAYSRGDWKEGNRLTKIYASKAADLLKDTWAYNRKKCKSHGFGRAELAPIEYPNNIGSYLGKYLVKGYSKVSKEGEKIKIRQLTYARDIPRVANTKMSWVRNPNGIQPFRVYLKKWAEYRGYKDVEEIKRDYGKHWAYHLYEQIRYDHIRKRMEEDGLPPIATRPRTPFTLPDEKIQQGLQEYFKEKSVKGSNKRFEEERKRLNAHRVNAKAWWHK